MVLLPDGRILVGGSAEPVISNLDNPIQDFALLRLNADGSYDTTFGNGGKVLTDFTPELQCLDPENGGFCDVEVITSLAVLSDGKILAAGQTFIGPSNDYDIALLRYNPDGSLDDSFGIDGKVHTDLDGSEIVNAMSLLADGRILLTGQSSGRGFFARYNSEGDLDTTFGPASSGSLILPDSSFIPSDMSIAADGTITVCDSGTLRIARFLSSGIVDTTFGPLGISSPITIPDYPVVWQTGMLAVPGGIVVTGALYKSVGGSADPFLAKFQSDPPSDRSEVTQIPKVDLNLSFSNIPKFLSRSRATKISLIIKNVGNVKVSGSARLQLFRVGNKHTISTDKNFAQRSSRLTLWTPRLNLEPGQSTRITIPIHLRSNSRSSRDFLYATLSRALTATSGAKALDQNLRNNSRFSSTKITFV